MKGSNMEYDVISGTGWGALNARVLAAFPKGQEDQAIDRLVEFWQMERPSLSLYQHWWPLSVVDSFYSKKSLFNHTPMKSAIRANFLKTPIERSLVISGLNLVSGEVVNMMDVTDNITALQTAVSSLILFEPIEIGGELFGDSTDIWRVDVFSPI